MVAREWRERIVSRHCAVVINKFTDDTSRIEAREPSKVYRSLGVSRSLEDTAFVIAQWEDVTWSREVGSIRQRISCSANCCRPVSG